MRKDLQREIEEPSRHLSLSAAGQKWDLYVYGISRVGRDWFVQIAVIGPMVRTVTVRVARSAGRAVAAKQIIALLHEWLERGESADHAFLEWAPVAAAS